jgi:hypothetical protein
MTKTTSILLTVLLIIFNSIGILNQPVIEAERFRLFKFDAQVFIC